VGNLLVLGFRVATVAGNAIAMGLRNRFKPLVAGHAGGLVRTQQVAAGKQGKDKKDRQQ
jgi:hypothetical protein